MSTGRDKFKRYKQLITLLGVFFNFFGKKGNQLFFLYFRNTNGKIGLVLRYVFLRNCALSVGDNVSIQPGVYLFNLHNLEIGSNVSIHPMCYFDAAGGLKIGSNVSIAHNCSILTANHQWSDTSIPIKYNKEVLSEVIINDDVWLGCGVRVLAGVKIERRSVVAAGAVVNKNVDENTIVGGVPAKKIKEI